MPWDPSRYRSSAVVQLWPNYELSSLWRGNKGIAEPIFWPSNLHYIVSVQKCDRLVSTKGDYCGISFSFYWKNHTHCWKQKGQINVGSQRLHRAAVTQSLSGFRFLMKHWRFAITSSPSSLSWNPFSSWLRLGFVGSFKTGNESVMHR